MPLARPDSDMKLWSVGDSIEVQFERLDPTTGRISWNLPDDLTTYDGAVVLLKPSELVPGDFPVDGMKYSASSDVSAPNDMSGDAIVVGAYYGDKFTNNFNIVGLNPDDVYYVTIHAVNNTLNYFSDGKFSYNQIPSTSSITGSITKQSTPPLNPSLGQLYYDTRTAKVLTWDGSTWSEVDNSTVKVGKYVPTGGDEGSFFYHEPTDQLLIFLNGKYEPAVMDQTGHPMYSKIGIGDDGSSDEVSRAINNIKRSLGWPVQCVELTEEHFNIALDSAISEIRRRADSAYKWNHRILKLVKKQQVYYLNDPRDSSDKIVDIIKIHRIRHNGLTMLGDGGLYAQKYFDQVLLGGGTADLTTMHLLAQYLEQLSDIFANELMYKWDENTRRLDIWNSIDVPDEGVILETSEERTYQELLTDRYLSDWIEQWAKAECMMTLGLIRSKFASLPGPNGGTTMNGSDLMAQANQEFEELRRQITDMEVGNHSSFGNFNFIMG